MSPALAAKRARQPLSTVNWRITTGLLLPVLLQKPALYAMQPKVILSDIPKAPNGSLTRTIIGTPVPLQAVVL